VAVLLKLRRIEQIAAGIHNAVEKEPAKAHEIDKLTEEYLPAAIDLFNAYEQSEDHTAAGNNSSNTEPETVKRLDNLISDLETRFGKLLSADALNVSVNVDVLKTMLIKDRMLEDELQQAAAARQESTSKPG
jgi:5-bromo-4-chloroindolyl phosphate hydrolysis protein